MTTTNQAVEILANEAVTYITQVARDFLSKKVAELAPVLTQEERAKVVDTVTDALSDDIAHHSEKVVERGFNEGRLEARASFLIEDWTLEGAENVEAEILDA